MRAGDRDYCDSLLALINEWPVAFGVTESPQENALERARFCLRDRVRGRSNRAGAADGRPNLFAFLYSDPGGPMVPDLHRAEE